MVPGGGPGWKGDVSERVRAHPPQESAAGRRMLTDGSAKPCTPVGRRAGGPKRLVLSGHVVQSRGPRLDSRSRAAGFAEESPAGFGVISLMATLLLDVLDAKHLEPRAECTRVFTHMRMRVFHPRDLCWVRVGLVMKTVLASLVLNKPKCRRPSTGNPLRGALWGLCP